MANKQIKLIHSINNSDLSTKDKEALIKIINSKKFNWDEFLITFLKICKVGIGFIDDDTGT